MDRDTAKEISKLQAEVARLKTIVSNLPVRFGGGSTSKTAKEGYLDNDMTAAFFGGESAGGAILSIWTFDVSWHDTGANLIVTNRDTNSTAIAGSYVIVEKINGEWRPIYISCGDEPGDLS
jgi:ubiquitin